jgi:N-acylneuraminate cytidylyltransferase
MKYVAFVFARGGSKGVPDKNLREVAGKSLLQRAIETALATPEITRVIVSTDSNEIAEAAVDHGAEVPFMRPAELATDESPEILSWRHALRELETLEGKAPEAMVSIPTTAPLRIPEDVSGCINVFESKTADLALATAISSHNPYFNMVEVQGNQGLQVPMLSREGISRRQDAPVVHGLTTVAYVAKTEYVLGCQSLFEGNIYNYEVDISRSLDVDTEFDLEIASILLNKREGKCKGI